MTVGQVNPKQLVVLLFLLLCGAGYAFYSFMYKPATAELASAKATAAASAKKKEDAQLALSRAQQAAADQSSPTNDPEALAKIQIASNAMPRRDEIENAVIELDAVAARTGVTVTGYDAGGEESGLSTQPIDPVTGQPTTSGEAVPTQITVNAHATFPGILLYVRAIQEQVAATDDNVYVHGRLMEITQLKIGEAAATDGGTSGIIESGVGDEEDAIPAGHYEFTVVVQLWTKPAGDDAAGLTDPNAASATTTPGGTAPTTDPNAQGATGGSTDPNAQQPGAAPATDPNAQGATGAPVSGQQQAAGSTAPGTSTAAVGAPA